MDSSHLNNSFHYISFFDKIDEGEELEDKILNQLKKIILTKILILITSNQNKKMKLFKKLLLNKKKK